MSIINNFEPEIQQFLREKQKELNRTFIGCLESDDSFMFKRESDGDLKIIDIVYCENSKCDEYKIPQDINSVNQHSWEMKCPNCLESYYPESDEELDKWDLDKWDI